MAKRTPPRPASTANLPKGLAAYWAKKGVPSKASGGSTAKKSSTKRKSSKRKRTTKKKN